MLHQLVFHQLVLIGYANMILESSSELRVLGNFVNTTSGFKYLSRKSEKIIISIKVIIHFQITNCWQRWLKMKRTFWKSKLWVKIWLGGSSNFGCNRREEILTIIRFEDKNILQRITGVLLRTVIPNYYFLRMRDSYKRLVKTWIRFANPWIRIDS